MRPGSEEYLDSEKYQLRQWDLHRQPSLAPLLGRLNRIRREQPAFAHLRTLRFHGTDNQALLCYSKTDPAGNGPPVLVVVNLDADHRQGGWRRRRPRSRSACRTGATTTSSDQLTNATYRWHGNANFVELDPSYPAHVFRVEGPCDVSRGERAARSARQPTHGWKDRSTGTATRSSTSCTSARSPTPTATGSATSTA